MSLFLTNFSSLKFAPVAVSLLSDYELSIRRGRADYGPSYVPLFSSLFSEFESELEATNKLLAVELSKTWPVPSKARACCPSLNRTSSRILS
ncbi:hypothetical protein DY000_02001515 [Brassica cretica]|uniref:Uncharacterized protein n=1 Tax=Brassica cretica TaxID=69181 RepID=A0ABQ7C8J6_BRACR|nr:hypothetical protein DY000_02001515 [Brassica cretica]